jgi:hypothetical protein
LLRRRRLLSKNMSEAARQRESVMNKRRDCHEQLVSSIVEALDQLRCGMYRLKRASSPFGSRTLHSQAACSYAVGNVITEGNTTFFSYKMILGPCDQRNARSHHAAHVAKEGID